MYFKKPILMCYDWDNTIVNTNPVALASLNELFDHYEMPNITMDDMNIINGYNFSEWFEDMFRNEKRSDAAMIIYTELYKKHVHKLALLEDAANSIKKMHNLGVKQIVISNKIGFLVREEAERFGIANFFNDIVGPDDLGVAKPDRAMLDLALTKNDISVEASPDSLWFFGDSSVDWNFAKNINAKLFFIGTESDACSPYDNVVQIKSHSDFNNFEIE